MRPLSSRRYGDPKTARRLARARGLRIKGLIRSPQVEPQPAHRGNSLGAAYARLGADAESNVEFATRAQAWVARRR